ncbi:MAG: hypothetical protein ACOZE5_05710 [Verrucomicrobiota bacterium]
MSDPLRLLLLGLLFAASLSAAEHPWERLRLGMPARQVAALLGEPVLRSKGHDFETWTYDGGAEVLLHGNVVGWTAPVSAQLPARSRDVWSERRPGVYFATLQAALPRPAPKNPGKPPPSGANRRGKESEGDGYETYLRG